MYCIQTPKRNDLTGVRLPPPPPPPAESGAAFQGGTTCLTLLV